VSFGRGRAEGSFSKGGYPARSGQHTASTLNRYGRPKPDASYSPGAKRSSMRDKSSVGALVGTSSDESIDTAGGNGIEEYVERRNLAVANDDHIEAGIVGRLATRAGAPGQTARVVESLRFAVRDISEVRMGRREDRQQTYREPRARRTCPEARRGCSLRYKAPRSRRGGAPRRPLRKLLEDYGVAVRECGRS
jgi:hypothetical protein